MRADRTVWALVGLATACLALTAPGAADPGPSGVSPNWSGYVATGSRGGVLSFTRVSGGWIQPAVACPADGSSPASVVWVGIGGYSGTAHDLEQIGTGAT